MSDSREVTQRTPTQSDDTVNFEGKSTESEPDYKPEGLNNGKRVVIIVSIALAGILGLSLVTAAVLGHRKSDPDQKLNVDLNDRIDSSSDVIDYKNLPTDMVLGYSFESVLNPEQQERISGYNDMSLEDFRALPDSEQLTFAYWVFENNKPKFDYTIRVHGYHLRYTSSPETAREISENYYYLLNFLNNFLVKDEDDKSPVRDVNTAKKCAILIHSFSPSPFKVLDETLDYVYSTHKHYVYTRPLAADETMREENGTIIVVIHQKTSDFNYVDPEFAYFENTYVVTEFQSIQGNTIKYYHRISSRFLPNLSE
jgi:hypothetical protein